MRTWSRLLKLATVVAVAGSLATTGASAAVAQENQAARACGGGVLLDGIRAVDVLEDEVYILTGDGVKIWPVTSDYVSMAEGARVEVDKCAAVSTTFYLWDDDGFGNPADFMGSTRILAESTSNHYFDNGSSRYRLGVIA